ncbi:MAG TPA: Gfo/Idh/MocA family oxidoreductase [Salinibacter sp.]|nr:Gfo/Idh/MocA family oxidoreductase [Salinibacter sp.]
MPDSVSPSRGSSLRIGVLGCGPVAQAAHVEACRKADNAELYALCDVANDLRERMAAVHQPQVQYDSYEDMLSDPSVDAVIVATADAFHVPAARQAVEAGKHVLVEKPLGTDLDACLDLRERVQTNDVVLQVGHMKRFDPGLEYARDFIGEQLGEMFAFKAWYADSSHRYDMTDATQPVIVQSDQARTPEDDPKADLAHYYMRAHGSHLFDTTQFLGGPIEAVRARHTNEAGPHCWFIDVAFTDGTLGHLDLTVAVRMDWHEGFEIYGEQGSVQGKTFNPWYFKASEVDCFSESDEQYHRPLGSDAHFYRRQVEGFANTILNGTPQQGTGIDDGIAVVRAMIATARSVDSGQWVDLDQVQGSLS